MKPLLELLKDFFIQRALLYFTIAVFSLFVIVPLGDLRIRFTDDHCSRCILYSDVHINASNSSAPPLIEFGEQEVCEYNLAVSSVFCLIYPLVAGLVYVVLYRRESKETREENKLDLSHFLFIIHIVVEECVVVMVLVAAGMVSAGFQHVCDSITSSHDAKWSFSSCSDAQDHNNWLGYDGSNFYICLLVTTIFIWLVFVVWLCQGLLGMWKLWRLNLLPVLHKEW